MSRKNIRAIERARKDFFEYCHLKAPSFYKRDRKFLNQLCKGLQDFCASKDDVLVVDAPPRHGKSRTVGCLVEWLLGKNQQEKIITGSYNETLSTVASKNVRNTISEEKADANRIVYADVFPGVAIKRGDAAMNMWSLENGYNNYLATSPGGTATGFGASILIIDDLIKNHLEAFNETLLDGHWEWFVNTMLSRLEEGGKMIIIMTRWAIGDLSGRALRHFAENGYKVRHISFKACQPNGKMLCDEILSKKSYEMKIKTMGREIASANYQQEPLDIKGRLYSNFKTYDHLPVNDKGKQLFSFIRNYTDTADIGSDYLCSIDYGVYHREAYVLDVIYTKAPMELTEPAVAKMIYDDGVNIADIESNNGGRGFARNIKRILSTKHRSNKARINAFHQSKNKKARILSNATWVMDHIYFPVNWKDRWPEYYDAMMKYQREGKNKHDDAPDATTGITEKIATGGGIEILR